MKRCDCGCMETGRDGKGQEGNDLREVGKDRDEKAKRPPIQARER